jgi:transposase
MREEEVEWSEVPMTEKGISSKRGHLCRERSESGTERREDLCSCCGIHFRNESMKETPK